MFLRILITLLIIPISSNAYGYDYQENYDVIVDGTPRFIGMEEGDYFGGGVNIECSDNRFVGNGYTLKDGNQYTIRTRSNGNDIPGECQIVFNIKVKKSLKSVCKHQTKKSYYFKCPFSLNISQKLDYS
uniref:ZP domain-containing protein n=1 Tax=Strongyloides papillosus TaxID=174720 RepID=A0A0N5BHB9_STREA